MHAEVKDEGEAMSEEVWMLKLRVTSPRVPNNKHLLTSASPPEKDLPHRDDDRPTTLAAPQRQLIMRFSKPAWVTHQGKPDW